MLGSNASRFLYTGMPVHIADDVQRERMSGLQRPPVVAAAVCVKIAS